MNHRFKRSKDAFTLIELLVVIAVIGILVGITFGVARGVTSSQNNARVQADLAAIAQGLEQFKARYGDYPPVNGSGLSDEETLNYSLTGRAVLEKAREDGKLVAKLRKVADDLDDAQVKKTPKFIDLGKMVVGDASEGDVVGFLDPWGNPYRYLYRSESSPESWQLFGYHLYSTGPDGREDLAGIDPATGRKASNYKDSIDNSDNIFVGE